MPISNRLYKETLTWSQGPLWIPQDACHLRSHLQAGIGHYHHLLLRLQLDYKMDLRGIVDFPLLVVDDGLKKGNIKYNGIANIFLILG